MAGSNVNDRIRRLSYMLVVSFVGFAAQNDVDIRSHDRARILGAVAYAMRLPPVTITAFPSPRSSGGLHDFHSEGDYWWPDSTDLNGPYVRRDGLTNPDNFVAHRLAMVAMSRTVGTLAAAAVVTGERRYALRALLHLRAWFVDSTTRMSPHLLFAQAIKGRVTGRGIGIIDTIHLIEVARSLEVLEELGLITRGESAPVKEWFRQYVTWLTTHPYGLEEQAAKNNHGTWWVAQVAVFARVAGNVALLDSCRTWYRTLLAQQMALDGSFPLETSRTKPYSYSLFNLEGMALVAKLASAPGDDLWSFSLADGRSLRRGIEFMLPFVVDKSRWPFPPDVMYDDFFPVRYSFLLFGSLAYGDATAIAAWKSLEADPENAEVQRNMPLRQPVLWLAGHR